MTTESFMDQIKALEPASACPKVDLRYTAQEH